jgi:hypothetical protein
MEPDKNGVFWQRPFVFSMMAWHLLENMGDFQRWNDVIKKTFNHGMTSLKRNFQPWNDIIKKKIQP